MNESEIRIELLRVVILRVDVCVFLQEYEKKITRFIYKILMAEKNKKQRRGIDASVNGFESYFLN